MLFDQEDHQTHDRNDEFIFGEKILVCPIQEANALGRRMYFPKGNWYNLWNDELIKGGKEIRVEADIESMPIFIKEGAIIPKYPIQQYVGEKQIDELTLDVYYKKGKEKSELYEDANDGYDYKKGRYSQRSFKLNRKTNRLSIQQHKRGKFITSYNTFKIKLHGLPFKISKIYIDNEAFAFEDLKVNGDNMIIITKDFSNLNIVGD